MWIIIVIAVPAVLAAVLWLWAIAPGRGADFTELKKYDYAHRGLHDLKAGAPENSMAAFRRAVEKGFGMELDVQLTRDKQVVVHHDRTLKRSCGAEAEAASLTLEELGQYGLFGTEERIPLFSQVLELVDGRTPLIVELKNYNDPQELCPLVMELLGKYKGLYCVESFDPKIVRWFRDNHPEIIRGQLAMGYKKGDNGLTAFQAFCGRNMLTDCYNRPHFAAYEFGARKNLSLRTACGLLGMQEVSWTLRTEDVFQKAKEEGCLRIFEHLLF